MNRKKEQRKLIITAVVGIVAAIAFGLLLYWLEHKDDREEELSEQTMNIPIEFEEDSYVIKDYVESYLFIGTDQSGREDQEGDQYVGNLADFLLLIAIDHNKGTYGFYQIDRNTMTDVSLPVEDGYISAYEPICLANCYGKNQTENCENTVRTVSDMLGGLPINGYYAINMNDIGNLNHLVGGITLTLPEDFTDADPAMKKGVTLKLTDEQANIYLRGRMTVGDGSNQGRMERQRIYMKEFARLARQKMDEDSSFVSDAIEELSDIALTDMPGSNISKLANKLHGARDLGILTAKGEAKIEYFEEDGEEHETFYPEHESVIDIMQTLYDMQEEGESDDE